MPYIEKEYKIKQGDHTKSRLLKFEGIDIANCTCSQTVRRKGDFLGNPVIAETPVTETYTHTDGEDYFRAFLTPTQTGNLAPGGYTWTVQVVCPSSVPPGNEEEHAVLIVEPQGV